VGLPVSYPREDLGFHVGLDGGPGLGVVWGRGWEELAEVAWGDFGDDLAGGDVVKVGCYWGWLLVLTIRREMGWFTCSHRLRRWRPL